MSIKKPKLHNNPLSWVEPKRVEIIGIKLSDVQQIAPSKLKENPLNSAFFKEESADYFDQLREDIEKRGIIVPLIAKTDDTLLAGHNRLQVARDIGLKSVPVQYVIDDLPAEAEREFIIKDNLFRRHFSTVEWINLYKQLYPDFDGQIQQETRGGGQKWNKTEHSVLFDGKRPDGKLTAQKIASDTGQKISAVQKQLSKYRKEIVKPTVVKPTAANPATKRELISSPINAEVIEEVDEILGGIEKKLRKENQKTIQLALKKIDQIKVRLENMLEKMIAE